MQRLHTLEEARSWFLSHSTGSVICAKGNKELTVYSYPEAVAFFGNRIEAIKMGLI